MTGGITFDKRVTLGNVVAVIVMMVGFGGMWWNFSAEFATAKNNIASLQDQVGPIPSVENRLTTVEVKQQAAADRGIVTQATLKDMQATLTLLLQQTAAINATLHDREVTR